MTRRNLSLVLATVLMVNSPAMAASGQADSCKTVHGEYKHWNGWPPFERVETSDGKMYGLISSFEPDGEQQIPQYPIPDSLKLVWDAHEDVTGDFVFCVASEAAQFKSYLREPMTLGWIKGFTPVDSSTRADFVRKIKVVAIGAATSMPGPVVYRHIDVSFDYLNGKVMNAKIDDSELKDLDDSSVLVAIEKADYPVMPNELEGMKLHIELPIYLGVGD